MTEKLDEKIVAAVNNAIANIVAGEMVTPEIEDIEKVSKKKWKIAATHAISVAVSYKKQLDELQQTTLKLPFLKVNGTLMLQNDFTIMGLEDLEEYTIKRVVLTMQEAREMGYEK